MAVYVLVLLVVASVATALVTRAAPGKDHRELVLRTRSWWVMLVLLFASLSFGLAASTVFFAFLSFWALKEFVTLARTRRADHGALVLAFLSIPAQYFMIARNWYGMFTILIPVYFFLLLPVRLVLARETEGFVASASQIQWGLMAFVFGLSHLRYVVSFPATATEGPDGRALVLFLVFVVEVSDVWQYVWGKTLGRHPVIPSVSPHKTWEGLVLGILSATAMSLLFRFLTPFSVQEALLVALLVCVAGFLGGAVMSAVKRDFGVKDFGTLIPGHGGMVDRLDALCYAAPVFFHYVRFFHYRGFGV
jgi:phosphatidate cytidylyltransferase